MSYAEARGLMMVGGCAADESRARRGGSHAGSGTNRSGSALRHSRELAVCAPKLTNHALVMRRAAPRRCGSKRPQPRGRTARRTQRPRPGPGRSRRRQRWQGNGSIRYGAGCAQCDPRWSRYALTHAFIHIPSPHIARRTVVVGLGRELCRECSGGTVRDERGGAAQGPDATQARRGGRDRERAATAEHATHGSAPAVGVHADPNAAPGWQIVVRGGGRPPASAAHNCRGARQASRGFRCSHLRGIGTDDDGSSTRSRARASPCGGTGTGRCAR